MRQTPIAYRVAEACEIARVGRTTLYSAIRNGDLQVRKVGRRTLIPAAELSRWLDALPISNLQDSNAGGKL